MASCAYPKEIIGTKLIRYGCDYGSVTWPLTINWATIAKGEKQNKNNKLTRLTRLFILVEPMITPRGRTNCRASAPSNEAQVGDFEAL